MSGTEPGTLGPDEKICPFCAEVIRAAAVKCRYCHSDLPVEAEPDPGPGHPGAIAAVGTAHDIRETPDETEAAPEETPAAPPPPPAGAPEPEARLSRAAVVMLAVCLVLALATAALWWSARPDDLHTAGNGQVTSEGYRSAAMSAAAANAAAVLSYGYKTLEADEQAARKLLTPGFAKKYGKAMDKAGPKATAARLTLKATVESTGLISLEEGSAKVLLFVNTITTTASSEKQQLNQNRVIMTMTRRDGDWVVSNLDAF